MNEDDQVLLWRIDNSEGEHHSPDVTVYIQPLPDSVPKAFNDIPAVYPGRPCPSCPI